MLKGNKQPQKQPPFRFLSLPRSIQTAVVLHLSYFDLKRLLRTSKAIKRLLEDPLFDRALFRGPPVTNLQQGDQVILHPLLQLANSFFIKQASDLKTFSKVQNNKKIRYTAIKYPAVGESATSPAVSRLIVDEALVLDTVSEGEINSSGSKGVTVRKVIQQVVKMWKARYNEEFEAEDEDYDEHGRQKITCWEAAERLHYFDMVKWKGWKEPEVINGNPVYLKSVNLST